jgi:lipoprotein-anchoring transpeptidase ErfK/SrfK
VAEAPRPVLSWLGASVREAPALRRYLTVILVVTGALLLLAAAAWGYEHSRRQTIAQGVVIGNVAVGGLDREAATAKLQQRLLDPLREPIVVKRWKRRWRLTAREARISADIDGSVDAAIRRSHQGFFVGRAVRDLTGGGVQARIEPRTSYSKAAVLRLVDRVRRDLDRTPREASVAFSASSVAPVPSRDGWAVSARRLHRELREAIVDPQASRTVVAHVRRTYPKVTTADLAQKYPTIIMVDRAHFRLTLFKDLRKAKTYRIAVGRQGLETPAGTYTIYDKQINPTWHVPDSDWAGKLAGKAIPPGPDNPIKARWMGFYDGAGIHGTDAINSIGTAASHGCVRMAIKDVIDLYDRVPLGTTIHVT